MADTEKNSRDSSFDLELDQLWRLYVYIGI
jgi:hypothetical protein